MERYMVRYTKSGEGFWRILMKDGWKEKEDWDNVNKYIARFEFLEDVIRAVRSHKENNESVIEYQIGTLDEDRWFKDCVKEIKFSC